MACTKFNKTSVLRRQRSQDLVCFHDYCQGAAILEGCLDIWEAIMPPSLTHNTENIVSSVPQRLGRTFLAMHISCHHFHQVLLSPLLDSHGDQYTTKRTQEAT
ncbi:hypothetical protein PDIG_05250 [Penicillium digitatum PHI26]|uniref:C6 transcription factor n=2 Tax=Penicillium digitatum TaxID=36651 RepID=K9GWP1_PEND2|nr:hypothetical protein PDIP_09920 [Penicillium digitatum Pd1]EKV19028.1 hypothetical protein PDIG_05250 [Penicillium digitatum PHI26]EKV21092.1 hypothetical protein PDIP_09920 [Penicillium digitatum Pd1]